MECLINDAMLQFIDDYDVTKGISWASDRSIDRLESGFSRARGNAFAFFFFLSYIFRSYKMASGDGLPRDWSSRRNYGHIVGEIRRLCVSTDLCELAKRPECHSMRSHNLCGRTFLSIFLSLSFSLSLLLSRNACIRFSSIVSVSNMFYDSEESPQL